MHPDSCPHATPKDLVRLILAEHARYGWGARKVLKPLRTRTRFAHRDWPARSTVFHILARHGCMTPRRRRRRWKPPGAAPLRTIGRNQIWTIDFKGEFKTRTGVYCYALTIVDPFSRYLLCCQGALDVKGEHVKPRMKRLFRECGLPDAIRRFPRGHLLDGGTACEPPGGADDPRRSMIVFPFEVHGTGGFIRN